MSLDKQRILSELGSVMNQLQSADCGCMGKLFNNGGQGGCARMGNPLPTCGGCRRGCCPGHGFGVNYASIPGSGEPFSMNAGGMSGGGMHPEVMHGGMNDGMQGGMNDGMQGGMNDGMQGGMNDGMHRGMHGRMHGGMPGGMRGGMRNGIQDGMSMGMGTRNAGMPFGGMNCMMGQNAPRLYADTYNYLNKNMMQPTMQEVYNDLKSITPENTIASNPLANQMGLSAPGAMNQGNSGGMGGQIPSGGMGGQMPSGGMEMPGTPGNPMSSQNTPLMGGMGANIVNMMSGGGGRPTNMPQGGQLKDSMLIDAPHSPHGQVGITPLAAGGNMGMTGGAPGQSHDGNMGVMPGMAQGNPATMMHNPTTQYVTQANMHEMNAMSPQGTALPQNNARPGPGMQQTNNMIQGNAMQQGQAMQQGHITSQGNAITGKTPGMMTNMGQQNRNPYGYHSAGIKKFNEMFPGVMQGDLNFDPMAIAVQMNPANQKQAAIDTMTKLMNGNKGQAMLQPVLRGANAAFQQLSGTQGDQQQTGQGQQQTTPGQQIPGTPLQPNQQQVYAANTGAPVMNQQMTRQQIPQQQIQGQEYQQGQQQIDPNSGAIIEGTEGDPNAPQEDTPDAEQANERADPSKNTIAYNMTPEYNNVQYNTLGQPVNLLPGSSFHSPTPGLPQTLNGTYRSDLQHMGVKNTMSKTAIAGTIPLGATASKSQLQHIYRQYRATRNMKSPVQGGSASAGNLNAANMRTNAGPPTQQIPMEKVGGDTMANNQDQPKMEQGMGQVGDAQAPTYNAPHGDTVLEKSPGVLGKGRNGLQDMAFTAYRGTTAWSFHG